MKTLLCIFCFAFLINTHAADEDGWVSLFDGKTLNGWTSNGKPVTKGWKVVDGCIFRESHGGDILTEKTYENFILEFEWKISEAGNSGVKYRAQGSLGLEYQVLDDKKHKDHKNPTHRAASLYDLFAAPDDKPIKPVGEWNKGKIVMDGTKIVHYLNGKITVQIDQASDDWKKRFNKSKYRKKKGFGKGAGNILLQDHNDQVWFRNIRIKVLPAQ